MQTQIQIHQPIKKEMLVRTFKVSQMSEVAIRISKFYVNILHKYIKWKALLLTTYLLDNILPQILK